MYLIPDSMHAFTLTQASLALLAISSVMIMIYLQSKGGSDHEGERQGDGDGDGDGEGEGENNLQSHTRQEIMLIAAFGFFWFAFRVALRAMNRRGAHPSTTGEINLRHAMHPGTRRGPGFTQARSYGCAADDAYCVVEEWEFF